jgi:S-adenosylmethionine hydrolase
VDETVAPYQNTFADVPEGQPLVYFNSLMNVSVAINMDSFAAKHKVEFGPSWSVEVGKGE